MVLREDWLLINYIYFFLLVKFLMTFILTEFDDIFGKEEGTVYETLQNDRIERNKYDTSRGIHKRYTPVFDNTI